MRVARRFLGGCLSAGSLALAAASPSPAWASDLPIDGGPDTPPTDLRFTPVPAKRVVETASGVGGRRLAGDVVARFWIDVPQDTFAVTVHVTAINPAAAGWINVQPCGDDAATSTLNFGAGESVSNQATIAVELGEFCVRSSTATDIVVDLDGVWRPDVGTAFQADSRRLWDTRSQGAVAELDLSSLTPPGATGVSLNVTADRVRTASTIVVWDCALSMPAGWTMLARDRTVANHVTIPISDHRTCVFVAGQSDLIIDLTGWWTNPAPDASGMTPETTPQRLADTRSTHVQIVPGDEQQVVGPRAGRLVVNATVDRTAADGWLAVYSCGLGYQGTSTVNYTRGRAVANATIVDATTGICALASTATDLIVDTTATIGP